MQRLVRASRFFGALALIGVLAGCRGEREEAVTTPPAAPEAAVAGAALGTEQSAGPFQVTLTTDPAAPKAGETRFEVKVTRNGQPVTDATVGLNLSMPTMNMGGPEVILEHTAGGVYADRETLSMGGEWQAKVAVSDEAETGTAVYRFNAVQ